VHECYKSMNSQGWKKEVCKVLIHALS
jgi:hypothetical protein